MSPRIKVPRKILNPPIIRGFRPYGLNSEKQNFEHVNLLFEEYEALRLSDYDMLNHHQASVLMDVSRPTFTRIYASALQKISKAFVEGKQISIEGGKVYFDSDWYQCYDCGCYFNNPQKDIPIENCPLCGSTQLISFDFPLKTKDFKKNIRKNICICKQCGHKQEHQLGNPCNRQQCPKCNALMKRG